MTKKLKLVGAERYISPLTNNEVIEKGGVFTFEDKDAPALLAEVRKDSLNNRHPVWEEVGKKGAAPVADEDPEGDEDPENEEAPATAKAAPKATAASRTRAVSASKTARVSK